MIPWKLRDRESGGQGEGAGRPGSPDRGEGDVMVSPVLFAAWKDRSSIKRASCPPIWSFGPCNLCTILCPRSRPPQATRASRLPSSCEAGDCFCSRLFLSCFRLTCLVFSSLSTPRRRQNLSEHSRRPKPFEYSFLQHGRIAGWGSRSLCTDGYSCVASAAHRERHKATEEFVQGGCDESH